MGQGRFFDTITQCTWSGERELTRRDGPLVHGVPSARPRRPLSGSARWCHGWSMLHRFVVNIICQDPPAGITAPSATSLEYVSDPLQNWASASPLLEFHAPQSVRTPLHRNCSPPHLVVASSPCYQRIMTQSPATRIVEIQRQLAEARSDAAALIREQRNLWDTHYPNSSFDRISHDAWLVRHRTDPK